MKTCPVCYFENKNDKEKYCEKCGYNLQEVRAIKKLKIKEGFFIEKDSYVVIKVVCVADIYLAKVMTLSPVFLKVTEYGPLYKLKIGDFTFQERETLALQKDFQAFLREMQANDKKIYSGLKCLGVTDDKLYEMLPGQKEEVTIKLVGCLDCSFVVRNRKSVKKGLKFCPQCGKELEEITDLSQIKKKKVFKVGWVKVYFFDDRMCRANCNFSPTYHLDSVDVFATCINYLKNGKFYIPMYIEQEEIDDLELYTKIVNE